MTVQVETLSVDALGTKILIMEHICAAGQRNVRHYEQQLSDAKYALKRNEAVLAELRDEYLRRAV